METLSRVDTGDLRKTVGNSPAGRSGSSTVPLELVSSLCCLHEEYFKAWGVPGYIYIYAGSSHMDQAGKVANPARGQLAGKEKNVFFPVPLPVRAWQLGLTRQVRTFSLASACSLSTLRLDLVLTHRIPSASHNGVHLFMSSAAIGPVPSLSGNAIAYRWHSLPRVHRHRAGSP